MSRYRDDILDAWIGGIAVVLVLMAIFWLVAIIFVGW